MFQLVLCLSKESSVGPRQPAWVGKPWIVPSVIVRTILIAILAIIALWLEFFVGIAYVSLLSVPVILWTGLILFVIWLLSLLNLLLLRATHTYVLRDDSLEIRTGILTSRTFVVSPGGFADMEVVRSISARIMNLGDIIIRTQDETVGGKRLVMIRSPEKVATQIREIMAKPIVRLDRQ